MERPTLPDALTAADSALGAVLATCLRADTQTMPALFYVERLLGGAIPDTFTAYPAYDRGRRQHFLEGERVAMLIRDAPPPAGPEFRRVFHWCDEAQFEVWHADHLRPNFDDSTAAALYSGIMRLPSLPRPEQVSMLAGWAEAWDTPLQWAEEVVVRHPEFWGEPLRDFYLERLRRGANQPWEKTAARRLALHPDTTTRAEFLRLAHGDSLSWEAAFYLGSQDRTPWVRQAILALGAKTIGSLSGPAPDFCDLSDHGWWSGALGPLHAMTVALSPDSSQAERQMLIRVAQLARPRHWLRYAALRSLARDTSVVVRDLIWQTVRGDPTARCSWVEDAPEPDEVTPYWTTEELHCALQDTSFAVRFHAYGEVARRRDPEAADTILVWLRRSRMAWRDGTHPGAVVRSIRTVGATRSPAAFAELAAWSHIPGDHIRIAVIDALRSLGDRRAAPLLRRLARGACAQMTHQLRQSLALALAELGDASDAEQLARWARECTQARAEALEGVGILAGVPRMVKVIRQIETDPLEPEQARDYELIEARVRERLAQRGVRQGE